VLPSGTTTLEAHYESVEVGYAVRSVRRVSSEIEVDSPVPSPIARFEKDQLLETERDQEKP
jgi:hypothetical protein